MVVPDDDAAGRMFNGAPADESYVHYCACDPALAEVLFPDNLVGAVKQQDPELLVGQVAEPPLQYLVCRIAASDLRPFNTLRIIAPPPDLEGGGHVHSLGQTNAFVFLQFIDAKLCQFVDAVVVLRKHAPRQLYGGFVPASRAQYDGDEFGVTECVPAKSH